MKNFKISILALLVCSALLHASEKPFAAAAVLSGDKINNGTYTLDYSDITLLTPPYEVVVARLKTLRPPTQVIATFQIPEWLKPQDYPQFSANGRYLLILNAPWSLLYQERPTTYEWNLFDIAQQKTIARFPWHTYPTFMKNKNGIILSNGSEYLIQ